MDDRHTRDDPDVTPIVGVAFIGIFQGAIPLVSRSVLGHEEDR